MPAIVSLPPAALDTPVDRNKLSLELETMELFKASIELKINRVMLQMRELLTSDQNLGKEKGVDREAPNLVAPMQQVLFKSRKEL
ncbi:hypothetical protein V6N12_003426 [Hibiscus sabdariffa]|uniref:Uncharacterized protein n=1 Tax=Hibiscus sabdariffa TaxID=183260 RepID=A0ABR2ARL0_9ROSI